MGYDKFMPHQTNPFQQLTASIMAAFNGLEYEVKESVIARRLATGVPTEIDILITNKRNPSDRMLVEARDRSRSEDVRWIDELEGKSRSLGISRVIAVSRKGFTQPAIAEADARGIETMHIREAEKNDWSTWRLPIDKFGVNIDVNPIVRTVNFISPLGSKNYDYSHIPKNNIFLVNSNDKKKISVEDYLKGFVQDPEVINFVRSNNTNNATSSYTKSIPCDTGVGIFTDEYGFVPLIELKIDFTSDRHSYSLPLKHINAGGKKIHVADGTILGDKTRIVIEEQGTLLKTMIETKKDIPKKGRKRRDKKANANL